MMDNLVFRVINPEVCGPSGAGSRAEDEAVNPRRPSQIRITTPLNPTNRDDA